MNLLDDKLAKKYARAFMNISGKALTDDIVEKIDQLAVYLQTQRQALFYAQVAILDEERTRRNLERLFAQFGVRDLLAPLDNLLLAHKRLFLLPRVLQWISRLALERKNVIRFTIESAPALRDDELKDLITYLEKKTGKQVLVKTKVNQNLIAGIKVYSESLGFEKSIRQQVRSLKGVV